MMNVYMDVFVLLYGDAILVIFVWCVYILILYSSATY